MSGKSIKGRKRGTPHSSGKPSQSAIHTPISSMEVEAGEISETQTNETIELDESQSEVVLTTTASLPTQQPSASSNPEGASGEKVDEEEIANYQKSFAILMKGKQLPYQEYKKQEQEWIIAEKKRLHHLEVDSSSADSDRAFLIQSLNEIYSPQKLLEHLSARGDLSEELKQSATKTFLGCRPPFFAQMQKAMFIHPFDAIVIESGKAPEKAKDNRSAEEKALRTDLGLSTPQKDEEREEIDLSSETPSSQKMTTPVTQKTTQLGVADILWPGQKSMSTIWDLETEVREPLKGNERYIESMWMLNKVKFSFDKKGEQIITLPNGHRYNPKIKFDPSDDRRTLWGEFLREVMCNCTGREFIEHEMTHPVDFRSMDPDQTRRKTDVVLIVQPSFQFGRFIKDDKPFPLLSPPARRFHECFSTDVEGEGYFVGNGMELIMITEEGFLIIPDPSGGDEPFILDTCGMFRKFSGEDDFIINPREQTGRFKGNLSELERFFDCFLLRTQYFPPPGKMSDVYNRALNIKDRQEEKDRQDEEEENKRSDFSSEASRFFSSAENPSASELQKLAAKERELNLSRLHLTERELLVDKTVRVLQEKTAESQRQLAGERERFDRLQNSAQREISEQTQT